MSQSAWVCDHDAIRRDLGWEPSVKIEEGARLTGNWYRTRHWI